MRIFYLFVFVVFLYGITPAQNKIGVSTSNYYTINSIFLNASSSADARVYLQFNWVGANAFIQTNQAYMPNLIARKKYFENVPYPIIDSTVQKSFVYVNAAVEGPAAVLSYTDIGLGTFVRARVMVDARNIPFELLLKISERDTAYLAQRIEMDLKNIKLSEMAWTEYGFNASKIIKKRGYRMIAIGGNLKYLTGINIAYANLNEFKSVLKDTTINIEKYSAKARVNVPAWNSGKGLGIDLGFTYKKMLNAVDAHHINSSKSKCKYIDYKYKIGVSLLDVGFIRFNKNTYHVNAAGAVYISRYTDDSTLINSFNIDTTANKPIWAILPSAISTQFDWNFGHNFYVNASLINSLTTPRVVGVQQQNVFAITPRYERKQFEVALPFSLQRYRYPQLGLAFRLRTFSIGVDNVIPIIKQSNTNNVSIYFNIGFSLFKNPACWNKKLKIKRNKSFWPSFEFKKEEKKTNENIDTSPNDNIKDSDQKNKEEKDVEPNNNNPEKSEYKVKRRFRWIQKRKENRVDYKRKLSINLTSPINTAMQATV